MKFKALLFLLLICSYNLFGQVINVTDYGATANDPSDDDQQAIRDAIAACSSLSNPELVFPVGTYHVTSTNGSGTYFIVNDINNLTIAGNGSTIEVVGTNYSRYVFIFEDCDNLNVNDITIDYQDPPASQGKIISTSSNSMDIQLFDGFSPEGKSVAAYAQYDSITGQQVNNNESYSGGNWSWLDQSENIIRIDNNNQGYSAGMFILLRHTLYSGYSFTTRGGKDIVFDGVKVKLSPGYAFLTSGSENVSYLNCRIEKKAPNFWATTNADGSHLTDVRGLLTFDNCYFESMCDDGINLHGAYLDIMQSTSNSLDLQSALSYYGTNYYRVGDTIEYVDATTLEKHGFSVISNILSQSGNQISVELAGGVPSLPNSLNEYKVDNISTIASLTVTNSTFKGNRARGILVNTRNVLIENCLFERTMMTAILFQLSPTSNESMPARNVIIRNNVFDDCYHYKTGTDYGIINLNGNHSSSSVCGIFKDISITGNTFRNIRVPAVYAKNVDQLEITGNTIESAVDGRNLIRFGECNYPVVENNTGSVPDNMGYNCTPGITVTGVSVSPTSATLTPTENEQLTATVTPSGTVTWLTDKPSIATVDTNGLVTAVAEGMATITAVTDDGSFTASSTVMVKAAPVGTNVALNKPVIFSAFESPNNNLVDGLTDDGSRWSASGFPQWAEIDLGTDYDINTFDVYPYQSRPYQYKIEVSSDGNSYTTAVDRTNNTTGTFLISDDTAVTARYVKITVYGVDGNISSWTALNELMVWGIESGSGVSDDRANSINFYPNPTNSVLNVVTDSDYDNSAISITDLSGRVLLNTQLSGGVNKIDLNSINQGVYILYLKEGNNIIDKQKIVKIK